MRNSIRLTKPLLEAIITSLDAAIVGDGFDGGDFDGMDRKNFERARDWAEAHHDSEAKETASIKPITDTMWLALNYMAAAGGFAFGPRRAATYKALERRGLIAFYRNHDPKLNRWELTEAGKSAIDGRRS